MLSLRVTRAECGMLCINVVHDYSALAVLTLRRAIYYIGV